MPEPRATLNVPRFVAEGHSILLCNHGIAHQLQNRIADPSMARHGTGPPIHVHFEHGTVSPACRNQA